MRYNIEDFGANPNNENNALYIQKAIDEASKNKGIVVIPKNKEFKTGTIVLKDNVTLYLEKGSVLKASDSFKDFDLFNLNLFKDNTLDVPSFTNCDYDGKPFLYFIYGKDIKNIKIIGKGTIDANGTIFYGEVNRYFIDGKFYPRMPLLFLENVDGLEINKTHFVNSSFWTLHIVGSQNILIDEIEIKNDLRVANCDGIDPDHSKNIVIKNSKIECADDAIVLKTTSAFTKYGNTENIKVSNCDLKTTSAAIKFGSETASDFKNIYFENINIHDSNRGISFQLRDSGNISDVHFKNINIDTRIFCKKVYWGASEPINITAINRNENTKVGTISNITFENISCNSENGIFIYGENKDQIKDIKFNNISLKLANKSKWVKNIHDLRPYEKLPYFEGKVTYLYSFNSSNIEFNNFNYSLNNNLKDEFGKDFEIIDSSSIKINKKIIS